MCINRLNEGRLTSQGPRISPVHPTGLRATKPRKPNLLPHNRNNNQQNKQTKTLPPCLPRLMSKAQRNKPRIVICSLHRLLYTFGRSTTPLESPSPKVNSNKSNFLFGFYLAGSGAGSADSWAGSDAIGFSSLVSIPRSLSRRQQHIPIVGLSSASRGMLRLPRVATWNP